MLRAYNECLSVWQMEKYLPATIITQNTAISFKNIFCLTYKYKSFHSFWRKRTISPSSLIQQSNAQQDVMDQSFCAATSLDLWPYDACLNQQAHTSPVSQGKVEITSTGMQDNFPLESNRKRKHLFFTLKRFSLLMWISMMTRELGEIFSER